MIISWSNQILFFICRYTSSCHFIILASLNSYVTVINTISERSASAMVICLAFLSLMTEGQRLNQCYIKNVDLLLNEGVRVPLLFSLIKAWILPALFRLFFRLLSASLLSSYIYHPSNTSHIRLIRTEYFYVRIVLLPHNQGNIETSQVIIRVQEWRPLFYKW